MIDTTVTAGNTGQAQTTSTARRKLSPTAIRVIGIVALLLVVVAAIGVLTGGSDKPTGPVFTIPEGAYKSITTPGIDSAIVLPTVFTFKAGSGASITIVNNDVVDHRAGPFLVGAGQTYTQRFPEPGEYKINCSVNAAESITVTVEG